MADKKLSRMPRLWIYLTGLVSVIAVVAIIAFIFLFQEPAHQNLAQVAYLMGDYDTALEEFNQAINQDPSNADYFVARGLTHMNLGNFAAALGDFNNAILLDPDSSDTRPAFYGGYIMLISENYDFAVESFSIAIERGKSSADVYGHRGLAFYHLDEYESAIIDAETAISLDDTVADYYKVLGDSHYALGNNDLALRVYNDYIELSAVADPDVVSNISVINAQE